jgi:phosphoglycerate dehydrogenase-like enzyme
MKRIAILDDYQNVAMDYAEWSRLPADYEITVFNDTLSDQTALVDRLRDFEIICAMRERTPFKRDLLAALPKLEVLVTTGLRNASIDVAAANEHGVTVCGTPSSGGSTAELAFGLIIAQARHFAVETNAMREGGWQTTIGRDLRGATLGVIGVGRLGTQVAAMGNVFGMRVIAWSQNLTAEKAAEAGAEAVSKETLFGESDFISVHLQLSDRSRGLIGAAELALMKPEAYLVNTSRGPIIDEEALVDALQGGRIAGAALDVYAIEPLPADHRLRRVPNLLLTPHIGYVTENAYRVFYPETLNAILAYLEGAPIRVITP